MSNYEIFELQNRLLAVINKIISEQLLLTNQAGETKYQEAASAYENI